MASPVIAVTDDADRRRESRQLLRTTHSLAEGAGAAGLAGLAAMRERFAGKSVAVIMSGLEHIDAATLRTVLSAADPR